MLRDGKIWIANTDAGAPVYLLPKMANRHGLIAGATGTGKTVTLKATLSKKLKKKGVTWKSSDTKVAKVSKKGKVTAKGYGTAFCSG